MDYKGFLKQFAPFKCIRKLIWFLQGCKLPPPHFVKEQQIKNVLHESQYDIFIETGTFFGDMVYALRKRFKYIHSIELAEGLYLKAVSRFKKNKNIQIHHGDSALLLPQILQTIDQPAFFWLDGHYCGEITGKAAIETPIIAELTYIANHQIKNHCILIDDVRLFNGTHDYPILEELYEIIRTLFPNHCLVNKNDTLLIKPNN